MNRHLANKPKVKVLLQFVENTLAYALPVFFQQFIVYPLMANKLGAEANGLFLAAIALNYFVINITATILANVRLLKSKQYEQQNQRGDFNIFLVVFAALNTLVIIGGSIFYAGGEISPQDLFLSILVVLLFTYHDYITSQYRVELRFRNILINNLLICAGYLVGLAAMYYLIPCWQIVFIVPYTITAIYDYTHTDYIKEPVKKTPLFNETAKQYVLLLGSSLLTSVVTYGDRLILYPLMDGTSVSVFTSAQLIGKMLQMIATPVASFLLAYMAKRKAESLSVKWIYMPVLALACVILYVGCMVVSKPLIGFLYPQWAMQSLQYVPMTALNGVLHMLNVMINVFALKLCSSKWQVVKSGIYLVAYMLLSFTLLNWYGLMGFCVGNVLASVFELVFLITVLCKEKAIILCK